MYFELQNVLFRHCEPRTRGAAIFLNRLDCFGIPRKDGKDGDGHLDCRVGIPTRKDGK